MHYVLAHAGHSHGLDLGLVALLTVGLLLSVWIVVASVRSRR